jgi:hypothetical protein
MRQPNRWLAGVALTVLMGWPSASLLPALAQQAKGIWDDHGTNAKSGVEGTLLDPGSTEGQSGVKPPPQTYFIPPPRQYEEVDPEEIRETKKRDYTPYALAQLPQTITYRGKLIPKGYYQIKLGFRNEGSPKTNLNETPTLSPEEQETIRRVLILKQLGKVVAVIPVQRFQVLDLSRKEKKKFKKPTAGLVYEDHAPVLQYRLKDEVYSTILED